MVDQILMVIAVVSFGLATAGVPARANLVALGLFCWSLTVLI
jgi:hypothetical protein